MINIGEIIKTIIEYINNISGGNQMIGGAISLGLMGAATYFLRAVPSKTFDFIIKHTTTELVTTSQNIVFHNLLKWLQERGYASKFRKIKLSNGRWGYSNDDLTKSVGYGTHLIWYKYRPILISLNKEETKSELDKETIKLVKFGRSHGIFDSLIKQISTNKDDSNKTSIYRMRKGSDWEFIAKQPKRNFDSIIIEEDKKNKLIKVIDDFISKEEWYIKHGIPWQLGILLYGPPGTGKTSIIKALSAYTDRSLSLISASYSDSISTALQKVPENSITVIEDIDACGETHKRVESKNKEENKLSMDSSETSTETDLENDFSMDKRMERLFEKYGNMGLADLLNAIDGVISSHGRILVMTTNHREKLDEALLRPGRVDIQIEIGYITMELFKEFILNFFPDTDKNIFNNRVLKNNKLTGAELQGDVLEGLDAVGIIEKRTSLKD